MTKSKLNAKKDKPVHLYPEIHRIAKRIAFQCEITMERLVNVLLEKDLQDRERLKQVLLELEADPRCLDEMI